jgi:hypothetical protein
MVRRAPTAGWRPTAPHPPRLASGRPPGGQPASRNARRPARARPRLPPRLAPHSITGRPRGRGTPRPPSAIPAWHRRRRARTYQPRELGAARPDPRRERDPRAPALRDDPGARIGRRRLRCAAPRLGELTGRRAVSPAVPHRHRHLLLTRVGAQTTGVGFSPGRPRGHPCAGRKTGSSVGDGLVARPGLSCSFGVPLLTALASTGSARVRAEPALHRLAACRPTSSRPGRGPPAWTNRGRTRRQGSRA